MPSSTCKYKHERTIRVLFVSYFPGPPYDGGNIHIYNVLRQLGRRVEAHLAYMVEYGDSRPHGRNILDELNLRVVTARAFRMPFALTNWQRLRGLVSSLPPGPSYTERMIGRELRTYLTEIIDSEKIDIIHSWSPSLAYSLAGISHIPKILTAGDAFSLIHQSYAQEKPFPYSIYHRKVARRFARYEGTYLPKYDAVVCFSERDQKALNLPDTVRSVVIPNGVDSDLFYPREQARESKPVFLFHGFLGYHPNARAVHYLIDVIGPQLAKALGNDGFKLRIVGKDPNNEFASQMARLPWLDVTGYVDDLPSVLAKADIYLAPIFSGAGIKNKVLEAISTGLPVVGTPEAFAALSIRNKVHGIIAEKGDLVKGALELLSDRSLRRKIGAAGRKLVSQHYSWQSVSEAYYNLYKDVLSGKKVL